MCCVIELYDHNDHVVCNSFFVCVSGCCCSYLCIYINKVDKFIDLYIFLLQKLSANRNITNFIESILNKIN